MAQKLLVLNAGSSSLKFKVFGVNSLKAGTQLSCEQEVISGQSVGCT